MNHSIGDPVGPVKESNFHKYSSKAINEIDIGETKYDLQTNSTPQKRIYLYNDGTIGAVWTRGISSPAFADRGTGYNYFNGGTWGSFPTTRIESFRTGWPNYAALGANGEIVVSHDFAVGSPGLVVNTRAAKGTGSWTESIHYGPTGQDIAWSQMVTAGVNHDTVHVIYITKPVANGGTVFHGLNGALLYSRSKDGGVTWDIDNMILPGTDSSHFVGFSGDVYSWAEPKGDTLAFVTGNNWFDLFVMKSFDGGDTWTKKTVFQHPYPMFDETSTLVLDTPYVCDGSLAIAFNNNGIAHIAFGLMRVLNTDTTDAQTSYFPYTNGLGYWNEDMMQLITLNIDSLDQSGNLVGYIIDGDGDEVFTWLTGSDVIGKYYQSLTSYPGIVIDGNNDIYISYSGVTENYHNTVQHYRHLFSRKSTDGGQLWGDISDLTCDVIHDYDECMYASLAPNSDTSIHLVFMADYEPGIAVNGDEDPYGNNRIVYMNVVKSDWGNSSLDIVENSNITYISQNYPNPFNDYTNINVKLSTPAIIKMEIGTLLGQIVYSSNLGIKGSGNHILTISADDLSPGIYFYTIYANKYFVTKKMIVE